jgi:hypothetical protein
MVEPNGVAAPSPLVDEITRRMTAAWRCRRDSDYAAAGVHHCVCGARSDNLDHWVGTSPEVLTNSLCIHYLAFHRPQLPNEELKKVLALPYGEAEPDEAELAAPVPKPRASKPGRPRRIP